MGGRAVPVVLAGSGEDPDEDSCSGREWRRRGGSYFRGRIHRTGKQIGREARKGGVEGGCRAPGRGKAVPRDGGNPERAGVGSRSHFLWADLSAVTNTECDPELQLFSTEKGQLSQTPQQCARGWRAAAWLCTSLHPLQNAKCTAGSSSLRCPGLRLQHFKSLPCTGDAKCISKSFWSFGFPFSHRWPFQPLAPIFNLFNEISFPVIPETGNL